MKNADGGSPRETDRIARMGAVWPLVATVVVKTEAAVREHREIWESDEAPVSSEFDSENCFGVRKGKEKEEGGAFFVRKERCGGFYFCVCVWSLICFEVKGLASLESKKKEKINYSFSPSFSRSDWKILLQ